MNERGTEERSGSRIKNSIRRKMSVSRDIRPLPGALVDKCKSSLPEENVLKALDGLEDWEKEIVEMRFGIGREREARPFKISALTGIPTVEVIYALENCYLKLKSGLESL